MTTAEPIRVRTPGGVSVGWVTDLSGRWAAVDDRHGFSRLSLHDSREAAEAAVVHRSEHSDAELDRQAEDIAVCLAEIQRMRDELSRPITRERLGQILSCIERQAWGRT